MKLHEMLQGLEKVINIRADIELINSKPEITAEDGANLRCLHRRFRKLGSRYAREFEKFLKVPP